MPITRKLIKIGHSRNVTLPSTWLSYAETKAKRKIVAVAMEVNGSIILKPIFEEVKA
jgi:hypothetical protein